MILTITVDPNMIMIYDTYHRIYYMMNDTSTEDVPSGKRLHNYGNSPCY